MYVKSKYICIIKLNKLFIFCQTDQHLRKLTKDLVDDADLTICCPAIFFTFMCRLAIDEDETLLIQECQDTLK